MFRLIRALLAIAAIVYLISFAGANTAADPVPHVPARVSRATAQPAPPSRPGPTVAYTATAYCQHGVTQSGVGTRAGIAAGDPVQLPVGSVVHVETAVRKYNGIYTVLDTGSKVLGHKVDLFMHDCTEAQQFGKQRARVTVLRKGWNPKASVPKTVVAGPAIR